MKPGGMKPGAIELGEIELGVGMNLGVLNGTPESKTPDLMLNQHFALRLELIADRSNTPTATRNRFKGSIFKFNQIKSVVGRFWRP